MFRRIVFAGLLLVLELLPATATFLLLRSVVLANLADAPATTVATPTPSRAPAEFLGPLELLVYVEPFFAGTILFWLLPWLLILVVNLILGAVFVRFSPARIPHRPAALATIGLLLGAAFALPWLYALCRLLLFS